MSSDRPIRISNLGWVVLAIVALAPWAVVGWVLRGKSAAPEAHPPAPAAAQAEVEEPGPWGHLESRRITLEPPEEFIPAEIAAQEIRWTFKGYNPASLEALWTSAQLSPAEIRLLADPARREELPGGVLVLRPQPDLVLNLAPAARARIYTALAEFPENPAQREPFRFRADGLDEWFLGSNLPDDVVALTKRLLYPRNVTIHFSDYDLVLPKIAPADRPRYLKTLSRKSALLVTLTVRPDSDADALARYWGRGQRSKDVRPLLHSLVRQPGGGSIDIVHLMPPFPRSLLYTYPLPSEKAEAGSRDCHWTTFNFFREQPDERFVDIENVKQALLNDYYRVAGEPQLGDVLMFVRPNGVVVHSCVYIADDIVFTKNGPSFSVPWMLGKLENVVAFYALGQPLEVRRYRQK